MISQIHITNQKYRTERSAEIAAACDITANSISIVYYDLELKRRYARTALVGTAVTALNAAKELARLLITSMREYNIGASVIKSVGVAAPVHIESVLDVELSADTLYLPPETEIFFVPYISAGISGRFTASLLTLPDGECVMADIGQSLCIARKSADDIVCAAFPLTGAFDGSGLESGMPAENGAIGAVRREKDALVYEVVGDGESIGVSPCGAAMAVNMMRQEGIIDSDGIMTDRDLLYIGEDFFVSQGDVRAVQSDKARCRAAFEVFPRAERTFLSGEPFATETGLRAMLELGALPELFRGAGFCRNSVEQGIIMYIESGETREKAVDIARNARDITDELMEEFDNRYFDHLSF